ncbi:MAG: hypothetical protein KZQ58_01905 [gamma proteobacterium symbiont of Bathyaustriella thionipta]|nr:hypothetical protein [gamma proteobacterium symbiont of Bathyaustriella thionipta]
MSYYRSRRAGSRKQQRWGLLILALVALGVVAIFTIRWLLQSQQVTLDEKTLCPLQGSPQYVAVIFDKTDVYNATQQQFLRRYFSRFTKELPQGARVALYVIDNRQQIDFKPDLLICNPGSGQQANALYENPALLQKRWQQRFQQPLDAAIKSSMQPASAKASPIFEILQKVALSAFPDSKQAGQRRIILVSDMLQHTSQWSHYRGQMDFKALQKTPYYHKLQTDLQGAQVEILYVRRDGAEALQNKRHAFFWSDYIDSINGKVTVIQRIDG